MLLYQLFPGYYLRLAIYLVLLIVVVLFTDPLDIVLVFDWPAMDGDHPSLESELVAGQTNRVGLCG